MELSNSQKVIIIDNEYKEASPLINSLAIRGIPTIYLNGSFENIPVHPLDGVRIVFLDMRLSEVTDETTVNTFLLSLLSKSISINNGPYILFIWSKHDNEYLEGFKKLLSETKNIAKPYLTLNMEKSKFLNLFNEENETYDEMLGTVQKSEDDIVGGEFSEENIGECKDIVENINSPLDILMDELERKLSNMNSLAILFMWEKLVNLSAQKLVCDISTLMEFNEQWDNNIKVLIKNLARANAGKSLKETAEGYITNSILALNQMLPDELLNSLASEKFDEAKFSFINEPSITKVEDDKVYSISKPSKRYIVKEGNREILTFRKIEELTEDNPKRELASELYNKYLEYSGKSNFKLLCERIGEKKFNKLGSVYVVKNNDLLMDLYKSIFKEEKSKEINNIEDINGIKLIKLDISSACDYAQNKLKRVRILFGIMIDDCNFDKIDSTDDIYCTPELEVEGKMVKIAFNFHFISNEKQTNLKDEERIFLFRELMLTEIKHKLAAYISRVGIINI